MNSALQAFFSQTAPSANPLGSPLIMVALMVAIFYFLLIRPQQKQAKQHQGFVAGLKKGDEVVTQGGIIGTVVVVQERTVTLDVGQGNKLRVLKAQVASVWKEGPETAATEARK
jgi:preprotein translocase subunit YajC